MSESARYQQIFSAANARLADLEPEWCREVEERALRSLRFVGPRPPMVRQLLKDLRTAEDGDALRSRVHWTLRRLHVAMARAKARPEQFQTAANAYLDGLAEVAGQWLDADTLVRPWGER